MFQCQFKVTHRLREEKVLQDMCVFIIFIYVKAFEMDPVAVIERKRENKFISASQHNHKISSHKLHWKRKETKLGGTH